MLPLQAPEAEQELALVLDQERVDDEPEVMVVGLTVRVTVGGDTDIGATGVALTGLVQSP